uniref:Uncharacterized protein n=1 Tax=Ditylenchus dipsaci TaxID=166011 RepID=A0A915CR61_9BILA
MEIDSVYEQAVSQNVINPLMAHARKNEAYDIMAHSDLQTDIEVSFAIIDTLVYYGCFKKIEKSYKRTRSSLTVTIFE